MTNRVCAAHRAMTTPMVDRMMCLGLTEDQARLYDALLGSGPSSAVELAESVGLRPGQIAEPLELLTDIGLVGGLRSLSSRIKPLSPEAALDLLTRRRELELREASAAALQSFEQYRRTMDTDGSRGLLEVVRGTPVAERVQMLERSARKEIRGLDCPPYHTGTGRNPIEMENLARGVRYRQVYASEALAICDYLENNIMPAIDAGEQAKMLLHVPVKLLIIDQRVAVVSLTTAETDVSNSALVLRKCSLLTALNGLWEMCWQNALPIGHDGGATETSLRPVELRFLRLLGAGASDDQVARVLGISRRTFFRYLEQLMARTGTETRFQLAAVASRNGWI